jgi:hypothetical protein
VLSKDLERRLELDKGELLIRSKNDAPALLAARQRRADNLTAEALRLDAMSGQVQTGKAEVFRRAAAAQVALLQADRERLEKLAAPGPAATSLPAQVNVADDCSSLASDYEAAHLDLDSIRERRLDRRLDAEQAADAPFEPSLLREATVFHQLNAHPPARDGGSPAAAALLLDTRHNVSQVEDLCNSSEDGEDQAVEQAFVHAMDAEAACNEHPHRILVQHVVGHASENLFAEDFQQVLEDDRT